MTQQRPTLPASFGGRRTPARVKRPTSRSRRLIAGPLAGLFGAAVVDLGGRLAETAGVQRRPTLAALLVAKAVRVPGASTRRRGPTRRAMPRMLGVERPGGADPEQTERVGTAAHYLWGAGWGGVRTALDSSSGDLSAALTHFVLFSAADHTLLALANVGTPVWAPREDSDAPAHDAALQLAQLALYAAAANLAYTYLCSRPDRSA